MIDRAIIEKILDTAEIVDVISDFVSLKRRGANYIACCPFHDEKTPSFSVSPSKGIFKCFGCGKAGSAVTFIMEHEQLTYTEAIKYLGKKYGIEVQDREESPEDAANRLRHESLLVVSEFAQKFFADFMLNSEHGRAIGLSYFTEARGFTDETIRKFGLGFAPDPRSMPGAVSLAQAAQKAGYKKEFLIGTGLCIDRNDGTLADKFYDRVMFPIHSLSGRVIAFGGRTLKNDKSVAKYVNSPETEIYHKSNVLYGIFQAKSAIAKQQKCYLVEGYADVISMNQAGIENVVASSGTSLTQGQIRLIKRFTDKITVLYDGDAAGIKASIRGIDMLLEEGMEVKVALIPDGHDPDDFARSHSKDEIIDALNALETDFIEFKYELLAKDIAKDPIRKAELIKEIIRTISLIPDQIVRTVYIEQTSQKLDVKHEMLVQEVAKARRNRIISGEYEKQRAQEREKRRETFERQNAAQPSSDAPEEMIPVEDYGIAEDMVQENSNPMLEPSEREILYYLLKFGQTTMHFDEHQYFGSSEPLMDITVSQYITAELRNDELEFQNSVYKKIYNLYLEYEASGATNDQIQRKFIFNPDENVTKTVLAITMDNYVVNVKEFQRSIVPEENVLGMFVPKALLIYKFKVTDYTYKVVMENLGKAQASGDDARQNELMQQIKILTLVRNQFSKELNRLT